ncbi:MAG: methylmalonyl Co-A mutase-associated GTPase MeaB [Acidobacteria bacterium]|nr:methylmalonyl Co-A mutase-associated GTPase MeaB [Acidobacteriota bacterium]
MAGSQTLLPERILSGDIRALARACSLVENRSPGSAVILKTVFPNSGRAFTLGITGAPGAGKSTLTSALIAQLRSRQQRVAVLAVDPSSPFSGGAILGDRIRMAAHHEDAGVFIRSMATRGALGGLAPTTHDLALLLDAAGFDWILIETVGVGQDEVDVARLAQATAVILAPGMGDDVQAIKAGILEIADVFVLNKADQPGAARLEQDMHEWPRPLVKTVATTGDGLPELLGALETIRANLPARRTESHWDYRLRQMFAERVMARLDPQQVAQAVRRVAGRECDPYTIIEEWLKV